MCLQCPCKVCHYVQAFRVNTVLDVVVLAVLLTSSLSFPNFLPVESAVRLLYI